MEPPQEFAPDCRPSSADGWRAVLMADCTALFAGRVLAQAIQYVHPSAALPPFLAFQGSALPYGVLLPAQLIILGAMIASTLAVARGSHVAIPARGRFFAWFGALYFGGSLLRLGVGLVMPDAAPWFHAWISIISHLVLASFVLVLADCHRTPS
jgi:hypothetical protein